MQFFLHYGWFLQNLAKDFIRTNMHTTVNPVGAVYSSRIACTFTFTANIHDMNHFAKDCKKLVELLPA